MSIFSLVLFYFPRTAFRRAARKRLTARFPEDSANIWHSTLVIQSQLAPKRPRHSLGVNHLIRYFEWDCALYRAAQEHGMAKAAAGALIEEINWDVVGSTTALSFKLTRLRSSKLQTRIRWLLDTMFLVLFTSPFRRRTLPSEKGVAFDVVQCPLAAYFRDQGVPELTRYAACSLDHRMARDWGITLIRSQTIAEGAPHCDFRFAMSPARSEVSAGAQPTVQADGPASGGPAG